MGGRAGATRPALSGRRYLGKMAGNGGAGRGDRLVVDRPFPPVPLDGAAVRAGAGGVAGRIGAGWVHAAVARRGGGALRFAGLARGCRPVGATFDPTLGAGFGFHRSRWRWRQPTGRGKPARLRFLGRGAAGGRQSGVGIAGIAGAGTVAGAGARPAAVSAGGLALPFGATRLRGAGHADGHRLVAGRWLDVVRLVGSRAAAIERAVERGHGADPVGSGAGESRAAGVLAAAVTVVEHLALSAGVGRRFAGRAGGRCALAGTAGAAVPRAVSGGAAVAGRAGVAWRGSGAAVERAGLEFGGLGGFRGVD